MDIRLFTSAVDDGIVVVRSGARKDAAMEVSDVAPALRDGLDPKQRQACWRSSAPLARSGRPT